MKVTFRGINDKLYEQAKIDCIRLGITMGEYFNQMMLLRQQGEIPPDMLKK